MHLISYTILLLLNYTNKLTQFTKNKKNLYFYYYEFFYMNYAQYLCLTISTILQIERKLKNTEDLWTTHTETATIKKKKYTRISHDDALLHSALNTQTQKIKIHIFHFPPLFFLRKFYAHLPYLYILTHRKHRYIKFNNSI